jgi:hypothetical protein
MTHSKFRINIILLFIITLLLFFPSGLVEGSTCINSNISQDDNLGFADTRVNVTLSETYTTYVRETNAINPQISDIPIHRFFAIAKLTTHADILIEFHIEFLASDPEWNGNFTLFQNSLIVKEYRDFQALKELVPINTSVLEIESSSFEVHEESISESLRIFAVPQFIILRQTTVFLLSLPEPFLFDLNELELSQLSDFHYQHEFFRPENENEKPFLFELVRIKAPGSVMDYIPSAKGYTGSLYLAPDPWNANRVPRYHRHITNLPQTIQVNIELPKTQTINSVEFDTEFRNTADSEEQSYMISKNIISFTFSDYFPHYIKLASFIPLLEQFTITEYASVAVAGLAGLVTFLKGIPYFWNRRSFNKFKNSLHKAVENPSQFESLQQKARSQFIAGKISAKELEEIRNEVDLLTKYQERVIKKVEEADSSV